MRAHGDSLRNFSCRYLDRASSQIASSHIGGSSRRATLGQGKRILSGGPLSDATSHPKISNHPTTQPKVFPPRPPAFVRGRGGKCSCSSFTFRDKEPRLTVANERGGSVHLIQDVSSRVRSAPG